MRKTNSVLCMKKATKRRVWGGSTVPVSTGKVLRWADNMGPTPLGGVMIREYKSMKDLLKVE